jgi:hypothetical protein
VRVLGIVVVLLGWFAAPALAQTGATAPAYPGNTVSLTASGPLVAGRVERVKMSGHAQWKDVATSEFTIGYDLSLYVQNADVVPHCAVSYGGQLQTAINVGLNASTSISGFVMDGDLTINPAIPDPGVDWAGESLPFSIKPGMTNVILCAYQRYIIDDAAYYELPVKVEQPACKAVRTRVKRGSKLKLKCNVSGAAKVRFSGPRTRRVSTTVSAKNGKANVSTRSLRRGSYRVTVSWAEVKSAKTLRIRLR